MPYQPGTIARIDLSSGTIAKEPVTQELRSKYIGGRGINIRLLFDEAPPGLDPLAPEAPLIFGAGLLSGTAAPCPARFNVTAKSPLTGIVGDANGGGHFGPALKRAGIDHLLITGRADRPVYLWINDGAIEIRSAETLWGKTTREAEQLIRSEFNDKRVRVASIGPAGENLVKFANVMHQERSASRTGMGAVMGSKNLKAVAVRGTGKVELHDPEGFSQHARALHKAIASTSEYDHWKKGSASAGVYVTDKRGMLAVKNFTQAGGFEGIEEFNPQRVVARYYKGSVHCFGCPIGCGRKFEVPDGPFAGEAGMKIEEGAFGPVGPVCGNSNMDSIFKMNNVANDLGMDMHEMGQGMAVLMELQEEGIISPSDMDGISLTWGDHAAMLQMMEKVALREGIGNVLAEGIARAASHFGPEAERYVCHVKGMVLAALEPRMMKGTALGLATSTRGADHLRALVMAEFMPIMSPEEAEKKFGTADALELTSYNKAAATIYYQHLALLPDLFEICRFLFGMGQGTKSFSFDDLYELYRLATGIEADEEHMLKIAERIYTIERAFASRDGMRRDADHLKGKWGTDPIPSGPFAGERLDPDKWEVMLDDYYRLRGWNEQGVPTREKLRELGIEDVADSLERSGAYG
jgi:aldehyde:ferredoxin oxidoreductase